MTKIKRLLDMSLSLYISPAVENKEAPPPSPRSLSPQLPRLKQNLALCEIRPGARSKQEKKGDSPLLVLVLICAKVLPIFDFYYLFSGPFL